MGDTVKPTHTRSRFITPAIATTNCRPQPRQARIAGHQDNLQGCQTPVVNGSETKRKHKSYTIFLATKTYFPTEHDEELNNDLWYH